MPILFVCRNSNPSQRHGRQGQYVRLPGNSRRLRGRRRPLSRRQRSHRPRPQRSRRHVDRVQVLQRAQRDQLGLRKKPKSPAAADPILNMEGYLERKGLFSPQHKQTVISDFSLDACLRTSAGYRFGKTLVNKQGASRRGAAVPFSRIYLC